jgi:amino acid transporter
MARSGSLPAVLGKVSPRRKTPDNAITLMICIQVIGFVMCLSLGAEKVFPTWALAITLGLITMYILANLGVMKHYLGEARSEFNVVLHLIFPVVSTIAVIVVAYKSVHPLPPSPFKYAIHIYFGYTLLGAGVLAYLGFTGRDAWLEKARLAMDAR